MEKRVLFLVRRTKTENNQQSREKYSSFQVYKKSTKLCSLNIPIHVYLIAITFHAFACGTCSVLIVFGRVCLEQFEYTRKFKWVGVQPKIGPLLRVSLWLQLICARLPFLQLVYAQFTNHRNLFFEKFNHVYIICVHFQIFEYVNTDGGK